MNTPTFLFERLNNDHFTRIVAFGSSNTERRIAGMHWFDCFELACRTTFGPHTTCINSGRGGDTTADLLSRIERDCLAYHPHLAFLTVGGNDSNPDRGISPAVYRDNLSQIIEQIQACGCRPVLQTYYAVDTANLSPEHALAFDQMMAIIRDLGNEKGCMVIDHLTRWERLRKSSYTIFRRLLIDPLHINGTGNLVLGLDIARAFSLQVPDDPYFREAWTIQALLDELPVTEATLEVGSCG